MPMRRYKSAAETSYQVVIHFVVAMIVLSALLPLVYVVGMSLTSQNELIDRNFFVIIPQEPTLEAYRRLLTSEILWRAIGVSVFRAVVGPVLTLVLTVIGAFVLSRKDLPGRNLLLLFVVATILFRGGLIPSYLVMHDLHLLNTVWSLILPTAVDAFGLLVIKMFIENIPRELTEAAYLDGVSEIQMLIRIIIPLAAPAIAAIGMFNIVMHWVSWFDALVYIQDPNLYPLQLVLRNMLNTEVVNDQMTQSLATNQRISPESLKMATVVVAIIPILMVYPFLQKHFIRGVYMGAVK
jgi:putative aldouronate transport system permease protein